MTRGEADRRVRALRGAKPPVDPWRPLGVLREIERQPGGALEEGVTVFLAGSECPFTCVFCDLWRFTLDGPTPPGAIPRQVELALEGLEGEPPSGWIKLYNASNFFDPRAVPVSDWPAIARWLTPFGRVIVECHPRMVGESSERFAELLDGRLEVAMGLETAHEGALARLNKQMTLADFDAAARRLAAAGIGCRAFVLVGAPFLPAGESVEWAVRSAEHAARAGAGVVSLIPVRGGAGEGDGELGRLAAEGLFTAPTLRDIEDTLDRCLDLPVVVQVDPWDLERLAACPQCRVARLERLARISLSGVPEPRVGCAACAGGGDG